MGPVGVSAFTFRDAIAADRDAVIAISAITLSEHQARSPDDFPPEGDDGTMQMFDAYLDSPRRDGSEPFHRLIVACHLERVAGHVLMAFGNSAVGDRLQDMNCHIVDLSVHPDFRNQGIGAALLLQVQNTCRDEGVTVMRGYVWQGNAPSTALFSGAGFDPSATVFRQRLAPPCRPPLHRRNRGQARGNQRSTIWRSCS